MLLFYKLIKSICFVIPILFVVLIVHSVVHFKFLSDKPLPKGIVSLIWPDRQKFNDKKWINIATNIRVVNLFITIAFFVILLSFFAGNLFCWLREGDPNCINNPVLISVLIIGFVAAQIIVRNYLKHLRQ